MREWAVHKQATVLYGGMLSLFDMADKLFGAVFILWMSQNGITPLQISTIFAVSSISMSIFDYPSGNISDRYGRKRTAAAGYVIWGTSLIVFAWATDQFGYIASVVVMALGIALISGSPQSWLIDLLKAEGKLPYKDKIMPTVKGVSTLFAAGGAALSTLLVNMSLKVPLYVGGGLTIAVGIVTFLWMEDNYGQSQAEHIGQQIVENTKAFMRNKTMLLILGRNVLGIVGFLTFILGWQVYCVETLQKDPGVVGLLLMVFMLLMSAGSFVTSKLSGKIKPMDITALGMFIQAVGFLVVYAVPTFYGFVAGICVFEFGLSMAGASYSAWLHDYIPGDQRATFFSGLSALQSLAGFFVSIFVGAVIEFLGYHGIWLFATGATVITLVYFMLMRGQLELVDVEEPVAAESK